MSTEKPISLNYEITGSGWSRCIVVIKGQGWAATASYLGDSLGDLLEAILALKRGAKTSRCSFEEEPGEYRWIFESFGHLVRVRLLWFTWSGYYPDEQGELRLKGVKSQPSSSKLSSWLIPGGLPAAAKSSHSAVKTSASWPFSTTR